jgi:hypothetical protein
MSAGTRGAEPVDEARAGRLIRTVSRSPPFDAGELAAGRGGNVMRTVSFFGSFALPIGFSRNGSSGTTMAILCHLASECQSPIPEKRSERKRLDQASKS